MSRTPARCNLLPILLAIAAAASGCRPPDAEPTGKALYLTYCASCHGAAGAGDGPLAGSLAKPPSDLRRLAQRNQGRFDERAVMAFIDGERSVAEHGPREMPVWGAVFAEELKGERYASYITLLQARALTDYVRSLQGN